MTHKTSRQGALMRTGAAALAAMLALAAVYPGAADAQRSGGGKGKPEQPVRPAGPAYEYSSGIVLSYEPTRQTLTLSTGGVYHVRRALPENTLTPGDKVKLRWMRDGGERMADQIEVTMKAPVNAPATTAVAAPAAPQAPTIDPPAAPAS